MPLRGLYLLSLLNTRWETISINLFVRFSKFMEFDVIITVVDLVSKRTHFISTYTMVTMEDATRLFLHHVWKLHSLPTQVVLDYRPQFVIIFTKKLYKLLGVKIMSSTV